MNIRTRKAIRGQAVLSKREADSNSHQVDRSIRAIKSDLPAADAQSAERCEPRQHRRMAVMDNGMERVEGEVGQVAEKHQPDHFQDHPRHAEGTQDKISRTCQDPPEGTAVDPRNSCRAEGRGKGLNRDRFFDSIGIQSEITDSKGWLL